MRQIRPRRAALAAVGAMAYIAACGGDSSVGGILTDGGFDSEGGGGGDANPDSPLLDADPDAVRSDAATDAGLDAALDAPRDAALDVAADAPAPVYKDPQVASNWALFNASTVGAPGYYGAAFDGRYVYFVPSSNGVTRNGTILRYDTTSTFATASSWSTFNMTAVDPNALGYVGAVFANPYVYFVPESQASGSYSGLVVRYDTTAAFASAASYARFDTTQLDPTAKGFAGGAFDGRYVYLTPNSDSNNGSAHIAVRFDTQGTFTTAASWEKFDTTLVATTAFGFWGAVYDGRYVYYVPNGIATSNGTITRYDTQAAFTSAASWSSFNLMGMDPNANGFAGGTFDGRYLYLVPHDHYANGIFSHSSRAARYDTQGPFTAGAAWEIFDLPSINLNVMGFAGAVFDGRYVFFVPSTNAIMARFDTLASSFTSTIAWTTLDITLIGSGVSTFGGGAFDGEYVYFVPSGTGRAARFDSKTPASMPAAYKGSFF